MAQKPLQEGEQTTIIGARVVAEDGALLAALAARDGVTKSEMVRRAVADLLAREAPPPKELLTA